MTPKISAVVSDVDGALVTDDRILTPRAQTAVASSPDLQILDDYAAAIAAIREPTHSRTSAATGLMAETLNLSTSHMTDADLKAIAIYLKDQPGENEAASAAPDQGTMKAGAQIYADECSGCHAPDGKGAAGLFPALNGSSVVQQVDPTTLLHVVLRGARSVSTKPAPTAPAMPQFAWVLNDDEVAAVLTYIRNSWSNSASTVTASQAASARQSLAERSD